MSGSPLTVVALSGGVDSAVAALLLRDAGHARFLLSAGGDVVAAGHGPLDRPWIVGIEDPANDGAPLTTLELTDAAVATSSIAVRSWRDPGGQLRHHLIDPATLAPAEPTWSAVTVIDRDPAWAEVRSKVAFLAGPRIADSLRGRPAWWVGRSGQLHRAS